MNGKPRRAILIPANPIDVSVPAVGSILAHSKHINKHGKAFWEVWPPGKARKKLGAFPYKGIKSAYFYDVLSRRVRYKASVHSILSGIEVGSKSTIEKFVPSFRKAHWKSRWKGYWILISDLKELETPVPLHEFSLASGHRKVRQVRLYAIVNDPQLRSITE